MTRGLIRAVHRIVIPLTALSLLIPGAAMQALQREEIRVAPVSASMLPAPIEAIIASYANQCHQLGGALAPGADRPQVMTGDFDGDGIPDYLLDPQNLRCSAAATAFCGNGGCQIAIALSGSNYREPIIVLGGQPALLQKLSRTTVEVWVHGSNCNRVDRGNACWASFSWIDGKANTTYQAKPRSE
jgi:hypothetical protein